MLFFGADDSGTMKYFFQSNSGPLAGANIYGKHLSTARAVCVLHQLCCTTVGYSISLVSVSFVARSDTTDDASVLGLKMIIL
jgi:hypothetical protein